MPGKLRHNRTRFLYEHFHETGWLVPTRVALQQGRYELIRYRADPTCTELFALDQDPFETHNLAPLPRGGRGPRHDERRPGRRAGTPGLSRPRLRRSRADAPASPRGDGIAMLDALLPVLG
ncbi:MAG: hypothetical protein AB7I59_22855 [Geminicoccaceae bacterium]